MEFSASVQGQQYQFYFINKTSFLISGNNAEYILYKKKVWHCADDIIHQLLIEFGEVIEEHMLVSY